MTQHIRILRPDFVEPYFAHVWRDDQTLMWMLSHPDLAWPDAATEPHPIQFNPGDPGLGTSNWPGTIPSPIGDPPPPNTPDRRNYVALCGAIMNGTEQEKYTYKLMVLNVLTNESFFIRRQDPTTGEWFDPDVGNEPQP